MSKKLYIQRKGQEDLISKYKFKELHRSSKVFKIRKNEIDYRLHSCLSYLNNY